MAEEPNGNDWSQRIERALSGTTVEQFRELIDRLREDLEAVASRDDVAGLASREDLVRGLEAVAAAQRSADQPIDLSAIEEAVTQQAERVLGGFAQRVGQLQTAITQAQESLLERIERVEARIPTEAPPPPPAPSVDVEGLSARLGSALDVDGISARLGASIDDLASATRAQLDDLTATVEQLAARVDGLAAAPAPPPAERDDAGLLGRFTDELRALEVTLRTEIDAGFRAAGEGETKQVDALALRVTNLSMSVTQSLDAVRAQVAAMQDRAERLEAEQAAILEAIRAEVSGIGGGMSAVSLEPVEAVVRTVADRVSSLEGSLAQRLDAVDQLTDQLGALDQVLERVRALEGTDRAAASSLEGLDERVGASVQAAVEPLASMRAEVRELADQAIQLGALPQIEAQLRRVEDALGSVAGVPEQLAALPGLGERLDALGPLTVALERVQDEVAAIPTLREQVRTLAERPADAERLDALAASVEPLGVLVERTDALERQVASLDARLGGVGDRLGRLDAIEQIADRLDALARLDDVAQMLATVGARIDELPESAASTVAARVDAIANELWTVVERLPAAVDERIMALRDRIEQRLEGLHVDLGDVDRVREAVDGLLTSARENEQRLVETAAQVDHAATEMRDEVGRALSRVSVRLDGIEAAVARTILDVRASLEEGAKSSAAAVDGVGGNLAQMEQRLEALDQTAASVRAHLQSMPSPTEIAEVVTREVGEQLSTFRTATEARVGGLERDLSGVTTNVNEIWMRARGIAQSLETLAGALEEQGEALTTRIGQADARVAQVLEGEQRTAQRLEEVEQRVVAAARSIEADRDRVFVEAFEAMLDRLAKDERRLSKRLRGLIGKRSRRKGAATAAVAPPVASPGAIPAEIEDPTGTPVPDAPAPTTARRRAATTATKRASTPKKSSAKKIATSEPTPKKTAGKKKQAPKKPARPRSQKKVSEAPMADPTVDHGDASTASSTPQGAARPKARAAAKGSKRRAAGTKRTNGTKQTKRASRATEEPGDVAAASDVTVEAPSAE